MKTSKFVFEQIAVIIVFLFLIKVSFSQWTELEMRQIVDATNRKGLEIERMTKEAAIRHNQMSSNTADLLSRPTVPNENGQIVISPPIPPPSQQTFTPNSLPKPSAPPLPTIEDDRTFLAKMTEQEALVNQLNVFAAREAASRNDLLQMESSLLQALRPIVSPFLGQPIPGHFVPFQRSPRPIEEPPHEKQAVDIRSRPVDSQIPIRMESFVGSYGEEQNDPKTDKLEMVKNKNEQKPLL